MTTDTYDLVILGGGAAAFAGITEADRRGLRTALVNTGLPLGGTCVNVGCVPSKHLLAVGEAAHDAAHPRFGAVESAGDPTVDWASALDGTDRLVEGMRQEHYVSVAEHFETDIYEGFGRLTGDGTTIEIVSGPDDGTQIAGQRALVATGSSPWAAPIDGLDAVAAETSESILQRRDLPESMAILGGGYVGLEWGQILHRLGSEVTIFQRSDHVLTEMPERCGREIAASLREEGIDVVTSVDVRRVASDGAGVVVHTGDGPVRATDLFVATGVRPNSDDIGLDTAGIETDERGAIAVDEHYRTTNPAVYAAGDVIGDPMLETVAAREGHLAVGNAFDSERRSVADDAVPHVVYTDPEVDSVGVTEAEYVAAHGTCACRTVEMADLPKARATGETRGFLQVVAHHETDAIVGVNVVGARAADVISEATLAVTLGVTVEDVIDTIHPFPTFSEAFKRACQAFRRDVSTMSCCVE